MTIDRVSDPLTDLNERLDQNAAVTRLMDERMHGLEDRVEHIEKLAARVPAVEARISRVEKLMLEFQGEMRRAERQADEHRKRVEGKLDDLVQLIKSSMKGA